MRPGSRVSAAHTFPVPVRIPGDHGSARVALTGGTSSVAGGPAGEVVVGGVVVVVEVRPVAFERGALVAVVEVVVDATTGDVVVVALDAPRVVDGADRAPPSDAGGFVTRSPLTRVDESGELLPTASAIAKPASTATAASTPASVPY